ncbi:MAG: hypothetical protein GXO10_05605 [Crenarchaeota archaeon]|nr:hypothetical protein [Thermoproteota archaeon]
MNIKPYLVITISIILSLFLTTCLAVNLPPPPSSSNTINMTNISKIIQSNNITIKVTTSNNTVKNVTIILPKEKLSKPRTSPTISTHHVETRKVSTGLSWIVPAVVIIVVIVVIVVAFAAIRRKKKS